MNDLPRLELKQDQQLGRFVLVPVVEADDLADYLHEYGLNFQLNPDCAVRLAQPGYVTFLFGLGNIASARDALVEYGFPVQVDPLVIITEETYLPPLDQLLKLGEPKGQDFTFDYGALGITSAHVPELLRMVADEDLHTAMGNTTPVWAPLHAWRALAQLKAEQAVAPLLALLRRIDDYDDDWVSDDIPTALGELGRSALEPTAAYLADPRHKEWAHVAATKAMVEIGQRHPELRLECITRLTAQLERHADQSMTFNAYLVSALIDLEAREAMPAITQAFNAGKVDEMVMGDLEDIEIELGLKAAREHSRKPNRLAILGESLRALTGVEENPDKYRLTPETWEPPRPFVRTLEKTGRNDPCPCGSGKKYKKCCGNA